MSTLPLFDDAPIPDDVPMALRLKAGGGSGAPLSAAARAYNLQLQRVHKLREQLAELEALSTAHRQQLAQRVFPLQARHRALLREMALFLDAQLARPPAQLKLTPRQREAASQIVCSLARRLLNEGAGEHAAELQALHDRHSPQSLQDLMRANEEAMKEEVFAIFGPAFEERLKEAGFEEVLQAAQAQLHEAEAKREAERAQRQARRHARQAAGGPERAASAKARAAQARQQAQAQALAALQGDAEASLRSLYRQLASALHPDREPDEAARRHKTALMSEVNTAYARKDIVALMELQQRAALAEPQSVAALPEERLAALTHLLKAQVAELERERAGVQAALREEFGVLKLDARTLQWAVEADERTLTEAVQAVEADLASVREPAVLKRWLSAQRRLSEQQARLARQMQQAWDRG